LEFGHFGTWNLQLAVLDYYFLSFQLILSLFQMIFNSIFLLTIQLPDKFIAKLPQLPIYSNYPTWTSQNQKDPGQLIMRIKQISLIC